ncbi:MAG TPA: dTDP-4-dehydrorhamnose reductase [candidate division Zixibacteria bacterium]|nr:dTDP-4-dehydrorhamnose reductase [candidate division Zixibacteria bacterium]
MSRILVTGAFGLLGLKIAQLFAKDPAHQVLATFGNSKENWAFDIPAEAVSIADFGAVTALLAAFKPDVVINCAAYSKVDQAEFERTIAYQVNAEAVGFLAQEVKRIGSFLMHFSTDYIFDGKAGPYSEAARPNPLGYYAKTKHWGEEKVLRVGCRHLVVRTNVLFGVHELAAKPNFFMWLVGELAADRPVKIVSDQYNNPTLADNLAALVKEAVEKKLEGILNLAGKTYLSRYDFAMRIARFFGYDHELITPIDTASLKQPAPRPLLGGVRTEKAQVVLKSPLFTVEESLAYLKKNYESFFAAHPRPANR